MYVSKAPLAAEGIADALGIARSNVSNSLRELQCWNIIRSVPVMGDRRTLYTAETDLWNLVSRIAAGRKARELDPAAAALRECVETTGDDRSVDPVVQLYSYRSRRSACRRARRVPHSIGEALR